MRIVVTGADGFLGRHVRVALRAEASHDVVPLDRAAFDDSDRLRDALSGAGAVIHLAGINRGRPEIIEHGNAAIADKLVAALYSVPNGPGVVVYANSVHAGRDDAYGRGKQRAGDILGQWAGVAGAIVLDLRLANVFGEWCKPHYNSVVATFCHQLTRGEAPQIEEDRTINLVHAQQVASHVLDVLHDEPAGGMTTIGGRSLRVTELLERLRRIRATYELGQWPDLSDAFNVDLFNTYRSYLPWDWYPQDLKSHTDNRGRFVEFARSIAGEAQTSFSTTVPGITRGQHYHLRKIERYSVLAGRATIAMRPILGTEVVRYMVTGDDASFVDIPTMWTHSITNDGDDILYTAFATNELFDPARPDTYPEPV